MADKTNDAAPGGKIEFIENHRPALQSGDYEIKVTQSIKATKQSPAATTTTEQPVVLVDKAFKAQPRKFSVFGPRFSLDPQLIREVFPPPGSLGEHSHVLPHITFSRSTLPWERKVDDVSKQLPWLGLLLFHAGEEPETQTKKVSELFNAAVSSPLRAPLKKEAGDHDDDPVSVIAVKWGLLKQILPGHADLAWLSHVRQVTDDNGIALDNELELATLLCNRLPKSGTQSTVHLVSFEGHYTQSGVFWEGKGDNQEIYLVSLKSWRFACVSEEHSFGGLLQHLDHEPSTLSLPSANLVAAKTFVENGYVPAPHQMRQGDKTVSWYHSPLAPGQPSAPLAALPARTADELVRYDPEYGMFDVAYAAAWELGRLLTLQNGTVATRIFDWKRRHRHAQEREKAMEQLEHLPIEGQSVTADIPPSVTEWFHDLALLKGVPFNYLVPDERLLPIESLRFFWVDPFWAECLLDGAFSIGRVLTADHKRDADHKRGASYHFQPPHGVVTGFLLRSEIVSGWPDLQVDGYDEAVLHSNYEHPKLPPKKPIKQTVGFTTEIQEALNQCSRDVALQQFGFPPTPDFNVSVVRRDSSWLVNVGNNQELYLIDKDKTKNQFTVRLENALPVLRISRLSPNVLICLFAGDVMTVDIHQKPEALHFGLNRTAGDPPEYYRELKNKQGGDTKQEVEAKDLSWKENRSRVLNIDKLASKIKEILTADEFTSAQFAFQMTEGVQKVRFAASSK